tara:strand:- start:1753 stop:2835 length:1083 start_codon:yes stop_codon:yes gene_type:complete
MLIIKKNLISLKRENRKTNIKNSKGLFLNRNENPIDYSKKIKNDLQNRFNKIQLSRYPDVSSFKSKLSKFLKVKNENLFLTEGVSGAIKSLMEVYTLPKKTNIVFPEPTFAMYPIFAKMFDVKAIKIPYKKYEIDYQKLLKSINKKTSLVFLPNPNNPIEGNLPLKKIKKILKICERNKCLLILDEVYYPFGKTTGLSLIKKSNNIFVMRSLSKAGGLASIRLGYLIGNKKNIDYVSKIRGGYESNSVSMEIGSYFLENYNIITKQISKIKSGFKFLKNNLKKNQVEFNGGENGNYIFINLKNLRKNKFIVNFLKKNKIFVRSGWPSPFNKGFSIAGTNKKNMKIFCDKFNQALKKFKRI